MQTGIKCPYIGCEKVRFDSMYFVLFTLPINTEIRFALTDCDRNLRPQQMSTTTHEKVACTQDECCVACLSPSLSPTTRRPGFRSIRQAELSGGHQLQASLYAAFYFFFDFQICSRVVFFFSSCQRHPSPLPVTVFRCERTQKEIHSAAAAAAAPD